MVSGDNLAGNVNIVNGTNRGDGVVDRCGLLIIEVLTLRRREEGRHSQLRTGNYTLNQIYFRFFTITQLSKRHKQNKPSLIKSVVAFLALGMLRLKVGMKTLFFILSCGGPKKYIVSLIGLLMD